MMKAKKSLNRQLLVYIGFSGAIFVFLYSFIIANYFEFGLELHGKVILENEAKNFALEYSENSDAPLPENSTLISYRSLIDIPQVLLALHSEGVFSHGPMDMKHGDLKIFEREDFDKYKDAFNVDSLCFNDLCETVFFYSYNFRENEWLYMVMGLPDTEKGKLHNTEFDNAGILLVSISIVFFISIIVLTLLLIKKIGQPIANLAHWSNNLNLTNIDESIPDLKFIELETVATHLKDAFIRINTVLSNEKSFLNSASHELRTPIAVLSTNLSLLEVLMDNFSKESKEVIVLERLFRSVENMKQLTQTLLWLSKEPEDFPASSDIDLVKLLPQIIDDNNYIIKDKNIEIEVEQIACNIFAPEILCKIVLTNLIRNAFQYTQTGIIKVSFKESQIEIVNICTIQNEFVDDTTDYGFGLGLELVQRISKKLSWQFHSKDISGGRSVVIRF